MAASWRPAENMAFFGITQIWTKVHDFDVAYIVFLSAWLIYLYLKGWLPLEKSEELWHVTREVSSTFWQVNEV